MNSGIESSRSTMKSNIQRINDDRAEKIEESKRIMDSAVTKFRSMTNDIKQKHVQVIQDRIKSLTSQISTKGRSDADKKEIRSKIAELRAENTKTREELSQQFKNMQYKLKGEHSSRASTIKESAKGETARERDDNQQTTSKLRSDHKETSAKLKEEYDNKYYEALDELKSRSEFEKETKSKKSKASDLRLHKNNR